MSFTRRSFLIGAGSGLSALVLTACVPEATPSPTPTPTETSNAGVPSPAAFERSAWASDSFARGAMSYVAVRSSVDHRDALRQPIINRVFLCGEATSTDAAGTVRGAQRSGSFSAASLAAVADPTDKIAVVGAGAAGAEAARVLTLRGYDVTVIEARNRVGGRIHSFTSDNWPFPLELGAWRFSPSTDVDLLDTLERLDVETVARQAVPAETPPADVVFRSTTGEASADPVSATAVADALTWATRQWADVSLEQALTESGAAEAAAGATAGELAGAELLAQHLSWIATAYGADAAQLSSWFTPAVEDPTVFVTGELQTLVSDALDGVETFLSTTVVGVAYTDERVSLRLGTGESLAVDRVLITVPLGVLKDNGI
ncbi:MAG: hypothetical protein JWM51_656, partial [Microbacteriaceae bacterium]|nr:hypothetical protein [Microbacteriaceae bacterium]